MTKQQLAGFLVMVLMAISAVVVFAVLCLASFWLMQTGHDWLHTIANTS